MTVEPDQQSGFIAFLSYRHGGSDERWARKLQTGLETYRVPADIVATRGSRRMGKVFLDHSELGASSDLDQEIIEALRRSRYLVVVSSPRAATAPWIDAEIRAFHGMHGRTCVLAVLVEGDPETAFPAALRGGESPLVGNREAEPLAVDVRASAGGSESQRLRSAVVRLAAAMIGVDFDELWQRHRRRRRRILATSAGVASIVLALLIWVTSIALRSHAAEQEQSGLREQTEFLDARERGRQAWLANRPADAESWLREALALRPEDPTTRFLLGRVAGALEPSPITTQAHAQRIDVCLADGDRILTVAAGELAVFDAHAERVGRVTDGVSTVCGDGVYVVTDPHEPTAWIERRHFDSDQVERITFEPPIYAGFTVSPGGECVLVSRADPGSKSTILECRSFDAPEPLLQISDPSLGQAEFAPTEELSALVARRVDDRPVFQLIDVKTASVTEEFAFGEEDSGWVSLSPQRHRAVIVGNKGGSRLVELPGQRVIASWRGSPWNWGADFSSDGSVVICQGESQAHVRAAEDGRVLLEPPRGSDLWFAGDILCVGEPSSIVTYDLSPWRERARIPHDGDVVARGFGQWALTGADFDADLVTPTDVSKAAVYDPIQLPSAPTAIDCDGGGRLWIGCEDGSLTMITPRLAHRRPELKLIGHAESVEAAFFLADGRLVTVDRPGMVRLWSVDPCRVTDELDGRDRIEACSRASDASVLALCSQEFVRVVRLPGQGEHELEWLREPIGKDVLEPHVSIGPAMPLAAVAASGRMVASSTGWRDAIWFSDEEMSEVQRISIAPESDEQERQGRSFRHDRLVISPHGRCFAAANKERVRVFQLGGGLLQDVAAQSRVCAFCPSGEVLIVGCQNGELLMLTPESRSCARIEMRDIAGPVLSLSFDPRGEVVYAGTAIGVVVAIDVSRAEEVGRLDTRSVPKRSDFSAVGFDPGSEAYPDRLRYPQGISCVAPSRSGLFVAIGSNDGTVTVWGSEGELLLVRRSGRSDAITALDWSPDEALLVAGIGGDGAWLYDVSYGAPAERR